MADAEAEITNFEQPEGTSAVSSLEVLWKKALRCGRVYNDSRLKGVFINRQRESIRLSMRTNCGAHKKCNPADSGAL